MKKQFEKFANKKGVTLVELVVAMAIFSILALAISFIMVPTLKTYVKANELAELNTMVNTIGNQIINDLNSAVLPPTISPYNNKTIIINTDPINKIAYAVERSESEGKTNEILVKSVNDGTPTSVVSEEYYKNKGINAQFSSSGTSIYYVDVVVNDDGGESILTRRFAAKPPVLNQQ